MLRSSASLSIRSTSTICTALTPECPLKRPSARWQSWSGSAKSGISAFPKFPRTRPPRARESTQLLRCRLNIPCGRENPKQALLPALNELDVALVAYSPLGRGFLAGRIRTLDDLAPRRLAAQQSALPGEKFREECRGRGSGECTGAGKGLHTGAVGACLAAHTAPCDSDSWHQQRGTPRGKCQGRRCSPVA